MSALDAILTVSITTDAVALDRQGFGLPLILSASAPGADRYAEYTTTAEMVTAGFAASSPEVLAAGSLFSQSPKVTKVATGRLANKPTVAYTMTLPSFDTSANYTMTVEGEGVTTSGISIDKSLNVAAALGDFTTELNAVTGANYTASDDGTTLTVTGDAVGNYFSLAAGSVARQEMIQTTADPGFAADLAAIADENNSWYGLINPYSSAATIDTVATYSEANTKLYVATSSDSRCATEAVGSGNDPMDASKTSSLGRTTVIFHESPADFADAAWMGSAFPKEPGSITWAYQTLAGVSASTSLTTTHKTNMNNKNGNYYITVAGVNKTFNGTLALSDFIYVDVTHGIDALTADMQEGIAARVLGAEKIPYTDEGVAIVEADVRASLERFINTGLLAASPAPVIVVPKVADVSAADKTGRILRNVQFSATLAGAIHNLVVTGLVSF